MRQQRIWLIAVALAAAALLVGPLTATGTIRRLVPATAACSSGYVEAHLSWGDKCLRAGEFCKVGNPEYHAYGFDCPTSGHLTYYAQPAPATTSTPLPTTTAAPTTVPLSTTGSAGGTAPVDVGKTILLQTRTRTTGCMLAALPDRRCSPGAYYSKLTTAALCSSSFRTSSIRNVSDSEKHQVEVEYGLAPKGYGRTLEIDHIVSLELGGSNDIANLYPEEAKFEDSSPGFHVKDKLENKVHAMVCAGQMSLRSAQRQIANNWEKLYVKVYGIAPRG